MNRMPPGSGDCCLPNVDGITYIKLESQGLSVGMSGLDKVFQQLLAMGRRPEVVTDAELVGMARKFNWIPDGASIEADYAVALRQAYAVFYDRQEKTA